MNKKIKNKVLVKQFLQKRNLILPKNVVKLFYKFSYEYQIVYLRKLLESGWTKATLMKNFNLTKHKLEKHLRKSLNIIANENIDEKKFILLSPPTHYVYRQEKPMPSFKVSKQLKRLKLRIGKLRWSKWHIDMRKRERYLYSVDRFRLLLKQETKRGVSIYRLAKTIGVSVPALKYYL